MEDKKTHKLSSSAIFHRKYYYSRIFIDLEIVKFSRNREMSFLTPSYDRSMQIRYLNCAVLDIFLKHLGLPTREEKENDEKLADPWHFFKKNYNIYCSLASFDWSKFEYKSFSYNMEERKQQQELFREKIDEIITDFNGGFDFDGDQDYKGKLKIKLDVSQEEAVERSLKDLKSLLNAIKPYHLKYMVTFSGNRGVHFWYDIPLDISVNKKMYLANEILSELSTTLNLKTIDRVRLNKRKVFKMPYSLCTNKDEKNYVVLPLDNNQIENFKLSDMEMNNVYKKIIIKNRGILWRNNDLPINERIKGFETLLKDYEIEIPKDDVNKYGEGLTKELTEEENLKIENKLGVH